MKRGAKPIAVAPAGAVGAVPVPGKIVCVGLNYAEHVAEGGRAAPSRPAAVRQVRQRGHRRWRAHRPTRRARSRSTSRSSSAWSSAGAPGACRSRTRWTTSPATSSSTTSAPATGRACRPRSSPGQKGDGQWLRAKGSDTFLPMGPVFVTADEVDPAAGLRLRSWRITPDGTEHLMQDGTTADLIDDVPGTSSRSSRGPSPWSPATSSPRARRAGSASSATRRSSSSPVTASAARSRASASVENPIVDWSEVAVGRRQRWAPGAPTHRATHAARRPRPARPRVRIAAMRALVKTGGPDPGPRADRRPRAADGHRRRPDRGAQDRHLRHGPAHRRLGRLGAADHPAAARRRARVRRRGPRGRQQRPGHRPGRHRQRRGPRHLRPLPALPRRALAPVRQHDRARRPARRRVRRAGRPAGHQRVASLAAHPRGGRRDLRPVRQRGPHRAGLPGPRRGRPRRRGRPDRPDGHGRRPPRRGPLHRRQRAQRVPPRAGHAHGRDPRRRPARARPPGRPARAGHGRGLRRRPRDVRQRRRPARRHREHGPRRRHGHPGHPDRGDPHRHQPGRLRPADPARHLRPRDVRDLVPDVGDAPVRAGHLRRSSPTASRSPSTRPRSPRRARAPPAKW